MALCESRTSACAEGDHYNCFEWAFCTCWCHEDDIYDLKDDDD